LSFSSIFVFSLKTLYILLSICFKETNEVLTMSTKPPASVIESPAESLEKLAYNVIAEIPTEEPNDRNRLGYSLWGWLKERRGTLLQAICAAGIRSPLTPEEIFEIVRKRLEEKGINLP
jgi:hypothetical protein